MVHQQSAVGPDEGRLNTISSSVPVIDSTQTAATEVGAGKAARSAAREGADPGLIVAARLAEPLLGDDGFQAIGEVLDMHGMVDAGGPSSIRSIIGSISSRISASLGFVRSVIGVSASLYTPSSRVTAR